MTGVPPGHNERGLEARLYPKLFIRDAPLSCLLKTLKTATKTRVMGVAQALFVRKVVIEAGASAGLMVEPSPR
jgi:hypothetical protein